MDQLLVPAKPSPVAFGGRRLMRHEGHDRGEAARADPPHVQIGDERIAIGLQRTADLRRQIRGCRCEIEQDAARVPQEVVTRKALTWVLMCQPSASSAIESKAMPAAISTTIIAPVMAMTMRVRRSAAVESTA